MRFVVSGGGTAGHINPALALAARFISDGHEVEYVGTPEGMESRLAPEAGLPYWPLAASGYDRARPLTFITSSLEVLASARRARAHFRAFRPDAVIGFGGYVSLPVGMAALRLGIPLIAHEQNSVPGLTNRYLAKHGATMATTFPMTSRYLECPEDRIRVVGNPVRASILEGDRTRGRALYGIPDEATFLLVFGGSLGARHLNEALLACHDDLMALPGLHVVHSTGKANFESVKAALGASDARWQVVPYIEAMGDALAGCDAVISRAGSTSLMEIAVTGAPALLVPFPHATDDHQTRNASDWVDAGACLMVADDELDSPVFRERLLSFLTDGPGRRAMGAKVAEFAKPDAAARLASLVYEATVSS